MEAKFFIVQSKEQQKRYIDLLEVTGTLSNMFSESKNPFLHYRAMENIFCKAFDASNLSRSDVSVDAKKAGVGIGLKTFVQNNGNTFQKIAEFNKELYLFRDLKGIELVRKISEMRNERIKSTMRMCGLSDTMYHLITRSDGYMAIYEEHMDLVDIENIVVIAENKTTIKFTDKLHEYVFSLSKSTLSKRFDTSKNNEIFGFYIDILNDPYEFLLSLKNREIVNSMDNVSQVEIEDCIVLPLYNTRTQMVEKRSGLNQWNADGRARNENEVYVSIPSWIHRMKPNFFKYNTEDNKTAPFEVKLPNGATLSMKVAQQGGKALMSNPNSALGKWLLRDVLEIEIGQLVTREHLDIIGIDSVQLSKLNDGTFSLDFLKSGSFEIFKAKYRK